MDMSIEKSGEDNLEQKLSLLGEDDLAGAVGGLVEGLKNSSRGGKLFLEERNGFVLLLFMAVTCYCCCRCCY